MNYGIHFSLNTEISNSPTGIEVYDYRSILNVQSTGEDADTYTQLSHKKYPIYLTISKVAISFYLHHTKLANNNKSTGNTHTASGIVDHSNNPILTLPVNSESDQLTATLQHIFTEIAYYSNRKWINSNSLIEQQPSYADLSVFKCDNNESSEKQLASGSIVLRTLFLHFLYDAEHTQIFRISPLFDSVYSKLKENFLFKAILHKAEYYYHRRELTRNKDNTHRENLIKNKLNQQLPKETIINYGHEIQEDLFQLGKYTEAEKNWVETLVQPTAEKILPHAKGWMHNIKKELDDVYSVSTNNISTKQVLKNLVSPLDWIRYQLLGNITFLFSCALFAALSLLLIPKIKEAISKACSIDYSPFSTSVGLFIFQLIIMIVTSLFALNYLRLSLFTSSREYQTRQKIQFRTTEILSDLYRFNKEVIRAKNQYEQKHPSTSQDSPTFPKDLLPNKTDFQAKAETTSISAKRALVYCLKKQQLSGFYRILDKRNWVFLHFNYLYALLIYLILIIELTSNQVSSRSDTAFLVLATCIFLYPFLTKFCIYLKSFTLRKTNDIPLDNVYYPRLLAAVAAAWCTLSLDNAVYTNFFYKDISIISTFIIIVITLAFIYHEVSRLNPYLKTWLKWFRTGAFALIAFFYSTITGAFAMNLFTGNYLEHSDTLPHFYSKQVFVHNPSYTIPSKDVKTTTHNYLYKAIINNDSSGKMLERIKDIELQNTAICMLSEFAIAPEGAIKGTETIPYGVTIKILSAIAKEKKLTLGKINNEHSISDNIKYIELILDRISGTKIKLNKEDIQQLGISLNNSKVLEDTSILSPVRASTPGIKIVKDQSWIFALIALGTKEDLLENLTLLVPSEQKPINNRVATKIAISVPVIDQDFSIMILNNLLFQFSIVAMFIGIFVQSIFAEKPVVEPV